MPAWHTRHSETPPRKRVGCPRSPGIIACSDASALCAACCVRWTRALCRVPSVPPLLAVGACLGHCPRLNKVCCIVAPRGSPALVAALTALTRRVSTAQGSTSRAFVTTCSYALHCLATLQRPRRMHMCLLSPRRNSSEALLARELVCPQTCPTLGESTPFAACFVVVRGRLYALPVTSGAPPARVRGHPRHGFRSLRCSRRRAA
jgi:hypothetical protein